MSSTQRTSRARGGAREPACLLDTGFLYALADRDDSWHARCASFSNEFTGKFLAPVTVLPEVCYLVNRFLGASIELKFVRAIVNGEIEIVNLEAADIARSAALLGQYRDQNIGFVDATVIAISERLRIAKVATTDRRHFTVIRPRHCRSLTLLP